MARPRAPPVRGRWDRRRSGRPGRPTPRRPPGVEHPNGGMASVKVRASNGSGLEHLADARDPRPSAPQAERHVGAQARGHRRDRRTPAQRSTAAAFDDPPPSPPPAGMRRSSATWASRPTARSARSTRLSSGSTSPSRGPPATSTPVPSEKRQLVGQVEADHLGVDEVVAVGAHARHAQRHGELRRGGDHARTATGRDRTGVKPVRPCHNGRRGEPSRRRRAPRPGPRGGPRPARTRRRPRAPPATAAASCAAARTRPRPAGTAPSGSASTRGDGSRVMRTSADSTRGGGMNTVGGTRPDHLGVGPVGHLHRRDAVGLVAGAGGEPFADLALHHHQHRGDRRHVRQQVEHQRASPRCTAGWPRATTGGRVGRAEHLVPVEPHGVALHDPHPVRLDHLAQGGQQVAVELDRGDLGAGLGEGQRERAQSRADLDHPVARPHLGQAGDAAHGVGVGDEVLPQRPAGRQPVRVEEVADLAGAEGHGPRLRRARRTDAASAGGPSKPAPGLREAIDVRAGSHRLEIVSRDCLGHGVAGNGRRNRPPGDTDRRPQPAARRLRRQSAGRR